jgi:hypothetical protein
VGQHSRPEDADVLERDDEIPQEIAARKRLYQPSGAGVSMYFASPVHLAPLLVFGHNPECEHADDGALHERHDVHVPVEFCAGIEAVVCVREEVARQDRGDEEVDRIVEGKGEEQFVDVQREGLERDVVGKGLGAPP